MRSFLRLPRAVWIAIASAVSVVAVAAIQSRHGEDAAAILAPMERGTTDALANELARCRTITSDDTAALEACRRIWAKNRQNFFGSTKSPLPRSPAPPSLTSAGSVKEDRIPWPGLDLGRAH